MLPARRRTVYWPFALVVTRLTRRSGGPDIAEEAAAEAFATAGQGTGGIPNPSARLTATANRTATDRIRRENKC